MGPGREQSVELASRMVKWPIGKEWGVLSPCAWADRALGALAKPGFQRGPRDRESEAGT